MILKRITAASALSLLTTCLYAQGLNTNAHSNDWEEVNFEFNSSILSDGYPSLLRLAEILGPHGDYHVKVIGNTDYVGSVGYNQKLAQQRADTVRDFLLKYGANAGQIATVSEGKSTPAYSNGTKEGRFMNRRVTLVVTDGQGRQVSNGGVGEAIDVFKDFMKKQEECCSNILKRLDKLDDILAAVRDLKGENDRLKSELADQRTALTALQGQVTGLPKPLTEQQTTAIAKTEGDRLLDEQQKRNKKFSLLGVNIGPTFGKNRAGDFTFSGKGQFFSPFGDGSHAVQAQGEYMYYPGRQEGQFDIGLVNRWKQIQAGLFSSFKYVNFREFQNGGALAQGSFALDYLFKGGRVGLFGSKGFKNTAVLNRVQIGPNSFMESYLRAMTQAGVSGLIGVHHNSYLEGNLGFLQSHGGADRPGGMLRLVHPVNEAFALTAELGWNETYVNPKQSGRVVFGFQLGNFIHPRDYGSTNTPVPMDIPRIRYELLTRRVGNSPPVADAGPDQMGVPAGTINLDGSGSYDPDGTALTYAWSQLSGPSVALTGQSTAKATFNAADGQTYSFRLTVKNVAGLQGAARVTISTLAAANIRILSFSANPSSIRPGASTKLTWVVENADGVTITPSPGTVDARSGSADVTPAQTTTYRLTATTRGTSIHADVAVTVTANPPTDPRIMRFEATPTNIAAGESATLSWTTEGASDVTISGIGAVAASGSRAVTPAQTTTYTIAARGSDGRQVTAPVIVTVTVGTVAAARVLTFTASPATISIGATSQLCWNVEGATSISIASIGQSLKSNDCASVGPSTTTTYTLTAVGADGKTVTASTVLTVGGLQIATFIANPITSSVIGAPVTLTWTTLGATQVLLTGNTLSGVFEGTPLPTGPLALNGSLVVHPNTSTTYTLTAIGPTGQVTSVIYVLVR